MPTREFPPAVKSHLKLAHIAVHLQAVADDPQVNASVIADIMLEQAISLRSKDDISVLVLESVA